MYGRKAFFGISTFKGGSNMMAGVMIGVVANHTTVFCG